MNRYRAYGQEDDQPIEEGDKYFVGINQFDAAENLNPGQLQAAQNMDFSQAGATTRGGFVCVPSLGITQFGNQWYNGASGISAINDNWLSVAYGGGVYVAISPVQSTGAMQQVMVSSDGISWVGVNAPNTNQWCSICYGNGLFVAVAQTGTGNRVMTSPNGRTWTVRTSSSDYNWNKIVYGNGVFVAVVLGGTNTMTIGMTSNDGIAWTTRTFVNPAAAKIAITGIAFGGNKFVLLGYQDISGFQTYAFTSTDGVTWTGTSISSALQDNWAMAYGNNTFVAVRTSVGAPRSYYSSDGITWTASNLSYSLSMYDVVFGNGVFITISNLAALQSSDGINWSQQQAFNGPTWRGICVGSDRFVAVATSSVTYYSQYLPFTRVLASCIYSDPLAPSAPWVIFAGRSNAGFYSFGQTSRTIAYPSGYTISQQATVVQANNYVYIFAGAGQSPLQWNGDWNSTFVTVPASTLGVGYENMPQSNQATFYQNRLWAKNGKDSVDASNILDFTNFNLLAGAFNTNAGSSDYVVCSYPFGDNGLIVFKNKSVYLLQNVSGDLTATTSTEITRQLGIIGINACVSVGPDVVFMTDRNITSIRLSVQNKLQAVTMPLSRNISPIFSRVNWAYAYKVSMGYWNNQLFVAVPTDNSTSCNTILVYNFINEEWYGEWNFNASLNIGIQGFVTANYLGKIALHFVTEDGRLFVYEGGQNDISGVTVSEIAASITTRAYRSDNNNKVPRRIYVDASTNRPTFSITAWSEGAGEGTTEITNQTYARSQSWLFNDTPYLLTNANNDYNRAFRKDYATGPASVQTGTGILPEATQQWRLPVITRRKGRLGWVTVSNTAGYILINGVGIEARAGDRSNLTQIG